MRVRAGVLVLGLAMACTGDDVATPSASAERTTTTTTTSPMRPTTTTSTIYAPGTVEAEVEAAYLRSWEVYSEAVYTLVLDEEALASVYAEPLLSHRIEELRSRISDRRSAFVRVEHDLSVEVLYDDGALVTDVYVNHQVLIDPKSKQPTEPDPNETHTDAFALQKVGGKWFVTDHKRL